MGETTNVTVYKNDSEFQALVTGIGNAKTATEDAITQCDPAPTGKTLEGGYAQIAAMPEIVSGASESAALAGNRATEAETHKTGALQAKTDTLALKAEAQALKEEVDAKKATVDTTAAQVAQAKADTVAAKVVAELKAVEATSEAARAELARTQTEVLRNDAQNVASLMALFKDAPVITTLAERNALTKRTGMRINYVPTREFQIWDGAAWQVIGAAVETLDDDGVPAGLAKVAEKPAPSGTYHGSFLPLIVGGGTRRISPADVRGTVSIREYGAVGDGVVDSTTAINNAIQAAIATGKDVAFDAPGDYKVSDEFTLGSQLRITATPGVAIHQTSPGKRIFTGTGKSGIVLEGMTLYGLGAQDGHAGDDEDLIHFEDCSAIDISAVRLNDIRGQAAIQLVRCTNVAMAVKILNFSYAGVSIIGASQTISLRDSEIGECAALNAFSGNGYGVLISTDYLSALGRYPTGVTIDNCYVHGIPTWDGINAHGGRDIHLSNLRIENCNWGIELGIAYAGNADEHVLEDVFIDNVHVVGAPENIGVSTYCAGIAVGGYDDAHRCQRIHITNATVEDACQSGKADDRGGIYMYYADDVNINGCIIRNARSNGINFLAGIRRFNIANCTITNCGNATSFQQHAIYLGYGGIEDGQVHDNLLLDEAGVGYEMKYGIGIGSPGSWNVREWNNYARVSTSKYNEPCALKREYNDARPAYVVHDTGDYVRRSNPDAANNTGWTCIGRKDLTVTEAVAAGSNRVYVTSVAGLAVTPTQKVIFRLDNGHFYPGGSITAVGANYIDVDNPVPEGRSIQAGVNVWCNTWRDVGLVAGDVPDGVMTIRAKTATGDQTLLLANPDGVPLWSISNDYSEGDLLRIEARQADGSWVQVAHFRHATGRLLLQEGLGVGNTAAATTLGAVARKMEVFDSVGTSLGFVPIYNNIT